MRNLLLPGVEGDHPPGLPQDGKRLRAWQASAHGLRVEVYTAVQNRWLILAPVTRHRQGSNAMARVLSRYATMVQSLRSHSPRVRRYDLRAVRLVVHVPGKNAGYVVEAVGERSALEHLRQQEQGEAEIQPLRVREAARRKKGRKRGTRD